MNLLKINRKNKFAYRLPVMLLCILLYGTTEGQSLNNKKADGYKGIWFELNQKYPYGDKYSGGLGTYTADHFPVAIYAEAVNKTFFVYGGTTTDSERYLLCMIGCFDHKTGKVEKPTIVHDKQGVDDPHDNPSLLIDPKGYLWVFVSGRGTKRKGYKYRSTKPYSIDAFEQITSEEMTYPQPWQLENKMLHLFTKYSGIRELYFETSSDGYNWSEDKKLAGIRETGDKQGGHYQVSQANGNVIGTFFNRHPQGNVDKRTDLYYIQSDNEGQTWTNISGTPIDTPLEQVENPARVINYQEKGLNVYLCDMNFDKNGNPVCLYVTSKGHQPGPNSAPYIWHVTHWNGSAWKTYEVGSSDHNYDMGSLYVSNDKWLVVAPLVNSPQMWGAGGELVFCESTNQGKSWNITRQLTCNSTKNHGYVRRPIHARDPFLFFWADGATDKFSTSHLYFGNTKGEVWQLPYQMKEETAKPVRIKLQE